MKKPEKVTTRLAVSAIAISMIAVPPVTACTSPALLRNAGFEVTASAASNSYCESRASDGFFVVTATSLNVRKGAGTGYTCCGSLPGGTIIHGTGKKRNGLSLRKGPGTKFDEVTRIPNGTALPTRYRSSGWAYVVYTSGSKAYGGWVSTEYLVKQSVTHR